MNFTTTQIAQQQNTEIKNLLPEIGIEQMRAEIIGGLTTEKKYISSKFFYDKTGSALFEEITTLPEYYPTRTEKRILRDTAPKLLDGNSSLEIIELGSGDCSKISILFEAAEKTSSCNFEYLPVDVSKSAIEKSAGILRGTFPFLKINGYVADFIHQFNQIPHSGKQRLICFFGSTIGNFSLSESKNFFRELVSGLTHGDSLLVGFDLVKPEAVLSAAYNDSRGITSKFNKNILNVVNNIIHSDFQDDDFDSLSFYNSEKSRNEMHLVANKSCAIRSPFFDAPVLFKNGDSIHTENSQKYTLPSIEKLIENSGLCIREVYTDPEKWFALVRFGK